MRSTNRDDYQHVDRAVAAMAKEFLPGSSTGAHSHPRGQLLHAVRGTMLVRTADGAWIVPARHALWVPPDTMHSVDMRDAVAMRTVYIRDDLAKPISTRCKALAVSALMREAILALLGEPVLYDPMGRGGALAFLIVDELSRAAAAEFELPLPADKRLVAICEALIADPAIARGLDDWATQAGLSRRTLTRRFREETALSFGAWRRRLRAMHAAAFLDAGMKADAAARKAGYRNRSSLPSMPRRG